MKLAIFGTGYAGLVVGTCLAENGHQVTCVDQDKAKMETLQKGEASHYEPGLEELIVRNQEEGRLSFTTDAKQAVHDALLIFISVATPPGADGEADISEILRVAEDIAKTMPGYRIIAIKSAAPPGTAEKVRDILSGTTSHTFDVVVNPDFFKEGAAVEDFLRPDRIVVGSEDVRVTEIMRELYAPFLRTGKPFIVTKLRSAELTQYAVNAMLASRITMMNQFAALCDTLGGDIAEVREALASDERIGPSYLFPGIGFGGPGLPKDLAAAIHMAKSTSLGSDLLEALMHTNRRQQHWFIHRVLNYYGDTIKGKRLTLWGAAFKPGTDDLRGAQSLYFIDTLLDAGANVIAFDPVAGPNLKKHYGDRVTVAAKNYDALDGADGLIIATEWREFHRPDYERMAGLMRDPVVFDGRNLYTPQVMKEHGFKYYSVGRPAVE